MYGVGFGIGAIGATTILNSGGGFSARTNAFKNATGITDVTILNALNTFDLGLISNGLDSKLIALYPFVGGSASSHKYNFLDARDSDAAFRLVFNGGWTHSSTGALPNGTNAYIDSNISPSETTYTDFSYGDYVRTNSDGVYAEFGLSNANVYIYSRLGNESLLRYAGAENSTSTTDSKGFQVISQKSNVLNYYRGTTQLINSSNTPTDISANTNNFFLSARNVSGSAAQFSNREKSFAFFGRGLTSTQVTNLYNLVQTMQTSLSRNV